MRMTASWFGSLDLPNTRLWRDRSALERGLPSDRHLADPARLRSTVQPCWNCQRQVLRLVAEEATSLDSSCARRLRVGDEETSFHIEQRN